jgi:dipeptide transport system ATP-binding protein
MKLLEVNKLRVSFATHHGRMEAVADVGFAIEAGESLGIVGESGSGKSVTSLGIMGLIDSPGRVDAGSARFNGVDLFSMSKRKQRRLLGRDIAMIFQEPSSSLNPCFRIGKQIDEVLRLHVGGSSRQRRQRAIELLEAVGIADAEQRLAAYPHQLSGGMNQRVMIATAIACNPALLIADEPTTALDVTIQAQILELLRSLQSSHNMALILITHDLAVIAETVRRVIVMYAGEIVEVCPVEDLFSRPAHPYTEALLESVPVRGRVHGESLRAIPGMVPAPGNMPHGCRFHPRCRHARENCMERAPALVEHNDRSVRCFYPLITEG